MVPSIFSRSPSDKVARRFACILGLLTLLFITPQVATAEEAEPKDPYQSVWTSLSDLLRRREYASALALLDAAKEKPQLRPFAKQIESDKAAISELQKLQRAVREQASKLAEGTTLTLSGVDYAVIRYEKSSKGDGLILKSKSSGKESKQLIVELPSATWVELADANLDALERPALALGIFQGFDRTADPKAARRLLNEAADKGDDVTPWLARLDEAEATKKAPARGKEAVDPIIGHWNLTFPNGLSFNVEFRPNGTAVFVTPLQTLLELRKRKMPPPVANPDKGKWVKDADGSYRVTTSQGFTGQILVVGDHLAGRPREDGKKLTGTRQAKP